MATTSATKTQRGGREASDGKAAGAKAPARKAPAKKGPARKALTAEVSEVGGLKVDRSLEKQVDHISSEEAERQGKTARVAVPRTLHAAWAPPAGRRSPVDIIAEQAITREPDLVPIRHGRMMVTPFTFYRGAAAIMAADLAHTPSSGFRVQCCGDAHLLNFGGFASPERSMLFDVNDFDETLPGPWEWDVKRLAASIEVAGRDGQMKPADRRNAVEAMARQYRQAMREFAALTEFGVWYSRLDGDSIVALVRAEVGTKEAPNLEANLAKARSKDSMKAFTKLTRLLDGQPIISPDPPLIVPLRDLISPLRCPSSKMSCTSCSGPTGAPSSLTGAACSNSTGSSTWPGKWWGWAASAPAAGSCCSWAGAMRTRYSSRSKRPKIRCSPPSAARARSPTRASGWSKASASCRPPVTSRWAGSAPWGWTGANATSIYASCGMGRSGSTPPAMTPATLAVYGRICGWTLARAHARSGDRIAIAVVPWGRPHFRHRHR